MSKLSTYLSQALSLLVVFLLLAATAVSAGKLFGTSFGNTSDAAGNKANVYAAPTEAELTELGLSGATLTERDSAVWAVNGTTGSVVISSERFGREIRGFGGPVPLLIYIKEGVVQNVVSQPNNETEGYFGQASKLLNVWKGKSVDEAVNMQVDAVSGATYSSNGIIGNVRAALAAYNGGDLSSTVQPALGWAKTAAVLAVLLFGILMAWFGRKQKALRVVLLLANIVVLGFWTGQFISVSLLRGWMINGVGLIDALPAVVLVAVALILPWLGKKNFYCTWTCPYGSLQELAWRIPVPKIKVGAKAYRILRRIRLFALCLLLFLLWMGLGVRILDHEPFAAFMVSSAATDVLCLAAAFVVLGMFFPRPWCTTLCPVGMLLNLAEDRAQKPKKAKATDTTQLAPNK